MEKQANNLLNIKYLKTLTTLLLTLIFSLVFLSTNAQEINYNAGKTHTIGDITVSGNTSFNSATVISFSKLRKGDKIKVPGEKLTTAIKKLWNSGLFSSVNVYMIKQSGDTI